MTVSQYFTDIFKVGRSIVSGMAITMRYFLQHKKNLSTIQYPRERDLIPPRHRGLHYLETEKCVLCWKCSDICPVDCIYIEGTRGADGPLKGGYRGQKATISKFTVDYTVCIFCGLCEEPCPPKCIFGKGEAGRKAEARAISPLAWEKPAASFGRSLSVAAGRLEALHEIVDQRVEGVLGVLRIFELESRNAVIANAD